MTTYIGRILPVADCLSDAHPDPVNQLAAGPQSV
jgi:hypothetical protein